MKLRCLGGADAPDGLAADLARITSWPEEALEELWSVLGPSLRRQLDERVEQALTAYCRRYEIADAELAVAFKAARHLLHEAARRALPKPDFEEDLKVLLGDQWPGLAALLLPRYDEALEAMRHEIVRAALLEHGDLLLGADWRLDAIVASRRGQKLQAPVTMLTVRYRSQGEDRQLTLQALPQDIRDLRAMLDEVIAELPS